MMPQSRIAASAQRRPFGRAVVIGGSIAGLLSARALSRFFDKVTIVERDKLARGAEPRKAVPQGRHIHVFLPGGLRAMSSLLPGLEDDLLAEGAIGIDPGLDLAWHQFGVWRRRCRTGLRGVFLTRPLLEGTIAGRVTAEDGVETLEETELTGLLAAGGSGRITGVRTRARGAGTEATLEADLVVDAGGRSSRTCRWLQAASEAGPDESVVQVNVAYSTALYRRDRWFGDWKALLVGNTFPGRRLGILAPVEGDRWLLTLGGMLGDHPPTDEEGRREFACTLPDPTLARVMRDLEPISDGTAYKFPASRRLHYERLERFPEGFVVLGDAIASFNPIYAQGMTVAALQVQALGELLADRAGRGRRLDGLAREFFPRAAAITDVAWDMATAEDLRHPETVGERPRALPFMHWYSERLNRATGASEKAARCFHRVAGFLDPPTAFMRPGMALRVLWHGRPNRPPVPWGGTMLTEVHEPANPRSVADGAPRRLPA